MSCPECGSENIKEKGSFGKCLDCGCRITFPDNIGQCDRCEHVAPVATFTPKFAARDESGFIEDIELCARCLCKMLAELAESTKEIPHGQ